MSTSPPPAPERLRLDTKFFFGIGSAAESIALYSVSAYTRIATVTLCTSNVNGRISVHRWRISLSMAI